ncbi:hypothetical protein WA026_002059 [Henosepilachna vigintioctopunctata]|uniref:Uncharacterized protein n=1 Tax=Henosepilachna vigintioctopunctata TaxID=420089 RepID=A0AAW1TQA0_9CUCU
MHYNAASYGSIQHLRYIRMSITQSYIQNDIWRQVSETPRTALLTGEYLTASQPSSRPFEVDVSASFGPRRTWSAGYVDNINGCIVRPEPQKRNVAIYSRALITSNLPVVINHRRRWHRPRQRPRTPGDVPILDL